MVNQELTDFNKNIFGGKVKTHTGLEVPYRLMSRRIFHPKMFKRHWFRLGVYIYVYISMTPMHVLTRPSVFPNHSMVNCS
ncbi:hypothetical protein KUTeg_024176 [Tegillarca granosa]|uniref:Uncharacterized protein n=1 Tax=Tegillarca granosa TaxID=220873 RepID=A0ABQ9E293_TEGGR|nr:hypothetical protein KUTeg_024176 [Tegillarca granosa]